MSTKNADQITLVVSMVRDVTSVAIFGLFLLIVHYFGRPFRRGFNCDDESIRYPYKESTVEAWILHLLGALINILLITTYEYFALRKLNRQQTQQQPPQFPTSDITNENQASQGFKWRTYSCNIYCRLLIFILGMIISEFITEVSKMTIGRLRPHFFEVCQPRFNINGLWVDANEFCKTTKDQYAYLTEYECHGHMVDKEHSARLSFMSGHSSYAAYTATHAIIYLQSVMDVSVMGLVKPCVQSLLFAAALYTGLSRVSDYKHHWQDVLAGLLQGSLVAIVISYYVLPAFKKSYYRFVKITPRRTAYEREIDSGEELNHVY